MMKLLRPGLGAALLASTSLVAHADGPLDLSAANIVQGDLTVLGGATWVADSGTIFGRYFEGTTSGRANVPFGNGGNLEVEAHAGLGFYGYSYGRTLLAAHLYYRDPASFAVGVFGAYAAPLGYPLVAGGIEAQAYLGPVIVTGQALYGRGDFTCGTCLVTEWQARAKLEVFPVPTTSIAIAAAYSRYAQFGDFVSNLSATLTATQQLGESPVALVVEGRFDRATFSFSPDWLHFYGVSAGLRVLIGPPGSTLWSIARTGPAWDVEQRLSFLLSCFVGETEILMADGTRRAISAVRPGDRVIGENGEVNRVLEVETPLLADRKLYGFNGAPAFVTAEHPFKTRDGWRSIDPAATATENPALRVGSLRVGHAVAKLTSVIAQARPVRAAVGARMPAPMTDIFIETEFDALHAIAAVEADPTTTVYNLRLDGNHTYFANGYLVHNK